VIARLASGNPNKLRELLTALPGWDLALLEASDYPPETGETYYENARAKARFGRALAPPETWVLGEDSGIEADRLGGMPGVYSARWAGGEDPVEKLLRELDGAEERTVRYVCELVALAPDGRELRGTGTLEGRLAESRAGAEGFGYDPIFIPANEQLTVAELGNEWKTRNSHRARAARALVAALERL
jgi:XTP/dITP diphosphohydrolase